jgi:hypothetical protein
LQSATEAASPFVAHQAAEKVGTPLSKTWGGDVLLGHVLLLRLFQLCKSNAYLKHNIKISVMFKETKLIGGKIGNIIPLCPSGWAGC